MTAHQFTKQEQGLFKFGGLAAILGSIIFVVVFVIVGVFVGDDPATLEGWVTRFPDIRVARIFENSLYLLVLIIWILPAVSLFYTLKNKALTSAIFGMVLSILGLVIMSAGALPHVATSQLYDLHQAADATAETQATIVLMWQGTWAVFDALLIAGLAFLPIGLISYGIAMLKQQDFGRFYGWFCILLGLAGLGAIGISLTDPHSTSPAIIILGHILFHFIFGWKLFQLSRAS